ncbi:MAG: hypothetical protein Ta2E_03640 [Mycoplasmoidaceae bacterium]|nr:MAG: hypothetical protein Ta2E_03640 [Mycoplasmoidaceae bacterium]
MEFKANKASFIEQLKKVGSIIPTSSINPLFENISIECIGKSINLCGYSEVVCIKTNISEGIDIIKSGRCLVNAKIFIGIIDKLSAKEFSAEVIDKTVLKLFSGKFTSNINLYCDENTLDVSFEPSGKATTIPYSFFKLLNDKLLKLITTNKLLDNSPFRGVLLDSSRVEDTLESTTTDQVDLAYIRTKHKGEKFKIILEPDIIKVLSSHNKKNEDLTVYLDNNKILVLLDGASYKCSLIEGQYPSAMRALEAIYEFNFEINKSDMVGAIEKVIVMNDDIDGADATLKIDNTQLSISSSDIEKGSSNETISIKGNIKDSIQITINANELLTLIKNISTKNILFSFSTATKPIILKEEKNTDYISMILPIRRN